MQHCIEFTAAPNQLDANEQAAIYRIGGCPNPTNLSLCK
jgi:hypothetical protein